MSCLPDENATPSVVYWALLSPEKLIQKSPQLHKGTVTKIIIMVLLLILKLLKLYFAKGSDNILTEVLQTVNLQIIDVG